MIYFFIRIFYNRDEAAELNFAGTEIVYPRCFYLYVAIATINKIWYDILYETIRKLIKKLCII